jgi:hypothetical protein
MKVHPWFRTFRGRGDRVADHDVAVDAEAVRALFAPITSNGSRIWASRSTSM